MYFELLDAIYVSRVGAPNVKILFTLFVSIFCVTSLNKCRKSCSAIYE